MLPPPVDGSLDATPPNDGDPDAPGLLLIGEFSIEGVDSVIGDAREHVIVFYTELLAMMTRAGESWQLIRKEKYKKIKDALVHIHSGKHVADVKKDYPQTYK